jgi:hypothetical protein
MCRHKSCSKKERLWLSVKNDGKGDVVLHPWCINCGLVKNLSDDRSYRIGYWMNVLSLIAKQFSLKQVQKRLIAKELKAHEDFDDVYGVTGSAQRELFIKIIRKNSGINEKNIDSFID